MAGQVIDRADCRSLVVYRQHWTGTVALDLLSRNPLPNNEGAMQAAPFRTNEKIELPVIGNLKVILALWKWFRAKLSLSMGNESTE